MSLNWPTHVKAGGRLPSPAISCGVYRFPVNLAVEIAIRETAAELRKDDAIEQVIFACFDETVYAVRRRTIMLSQRSRKWPE